jgi:hypothetical protein
MKLKNSLDQFYKEKQINKTASQPIQSRLETRPMSIDQRLNTPKDVEQFTVVTNKKKKRVRSRKLIEKAKDEYVETGYLIKNNESTTSIELKRKAYSEILKINHTPNIVVTRTVKGTGDISIKPIDSYTRAVIVQSNLPVIIQTQLKPKVLIYIVDSYLTAKDLIDYLIHATFRLKRH